MAWIHEGNLEGGGLRIALVVSRFNSFITERLVEGALDCLERHGVNPDDIDIFKTPGAWEIPAVAARVVEAGDCDAVICLGAVIRGDTPHFEYVASESAKGIAALAVEADIPVIYGVITADSVEQAVDRAGAKSGNRGFDAALTAIEMASLYKYLDGEEDGEEAAPGGEA
jgi:6,7-dimethyl-8-ribityllumazine synthase